MRSAASSCISLQPLVDRVEGRDSADSWLVLFLSEKETMATKAPSSLLVVHLFANLTTAMTSIMRGRRNRMRATMRARAGRKTKVRARRKTKVRARRKTKVRVRRKTKVKSETGGGNCCHRE